MYMNLFPYYNAPMAQETEQTPGGSPEDEIRRLETQLEAKKRELAERGMPQGEEKEVFKEVFREHVEQFRPVPARPPPPTPAPPPPPVTDMVTPTPQQALAEEEREKQLQKLVETAMTRTIEDAVKKATAESPYLLDELHDRLVDDYYDKLVQLRRIKNL